LGARLDLILIQESILLINQHNQLLLVNIIFITLVQEIMSIARRMITLVTVIVIWFMIRLLLITSAMLNIVTTGILASGKPMITVVIKEKK
jgi:hypothetical protein